MHPFFLVSYKVSCHYKYSMLLLLDKLSFSAKIVFEPFADCFSAKFSIQIFTLNIPHQIAALEEG
jgi:hypothetical protein